MNASSAQLKALAQTIANAQAKGLKADDVFPEGIIAPDAVAIGGNLDPNDLGNLGDIIKGLEHLKGVQVFPRGILTPDTIRVQLTLHK